MFMNGSFNDLMRAAELKHREGDLDACAALCEQMPEFPPASILLGIVRVKTQRLEEAISLLSHAHRRFPDIFEAALWLGIAYRSAKRPAEALAPLRQAARLNPSAGVLSTLGLCYLDLNEGMKAVGAFTRAASHEPRNGQHAHNLGSAYVALGEPEKALEAFERAHKLSPNSVPTLVRLAQIYLELGDSAAGVRAFRQAYDLEPSTARGMIQLARALREEGQPEEAEAVLRAAVEREPDSVDTLELASNLLQQLGRFAEAEAAIEVAIKSDPERSRLYFNRVFCRKVGDAERPLLDQMQRLLDRPTNDLHDLRYLNYGLGKGYHDLGEPEVAIRYYDAANATMRELMHRRPFEREIHAREFDRKIQEFDATRLTAGGDEEEPDESPIFIVGMIRSGTTLVEQILSAHPKIAGGGELPFWFRRAYELRPEDPNSVWQLRKDYLAVLRNISPDAMRVTDKMPHNYMFLGQIHLAFPHARIIHCRRHPVDNCLSIYMTPYQMPLDFAHDRENIVFVYREYQRLMAHWRSVLPPSRFMEVDYETLVSDPKATTRSLVDFVGLDWDDACLRPQDNERAVKTPSMWQVRQPVYRSSVERWRRYEPWLGAFAELTE